MAKEKEKKCAKPSRKSGLIGKNQKLQTMFGRFRDVIFSVVFPDDCNCIVCGREIARGSKYCLCEDCFKTFPINNGKICVRCGAPIENEANYCLECQNHPKNFDFARSSLVYENDAQKLVLNMKFHNKRWLAKYFAEMMYDTYMDNKLDAEIIVPVPISAERLKERGYNQSELIARALAKMLDLQVVTDAVVKCKDNKRQTSLSGRQRRDNVLGAYKLVNRNSVKGLRVLLVDDILTTGSTMSEVSRKLKIAGAKTVYGLVIASPRYKVPSEEDNEDFTDYVVAE